MRSFPEALNTHSYPQFLHRSKLLFRLFQEAVHITTLRNWYVRRAIRRLMQDGELKTSRPVVVDVGCGAGDHLYYASHLLKQASFVGLDRAEDAVRLGRIHADGRLEFVCWDLQESDPLPEADILFCVTVLQYIADDRALLSRMRRALRPGGRLLLYVPVHNERTLPIYARLVEGSTNDYDIAQSRQHVYEPAQLLRIVREQGFEIVRIERAYGRCGKLAFELHGLILHGLMHERPAVKVASTVCGVALLPLMFGLMIADYLGPIERGNGILILAK